MKAVEQRTVLKRCLIVLFALYCFAAEASAQSLLKLDTSVGFSNTVRLGRWAPLSVTIENTGPLFRGKVEVDISAGDELDGTTFNYTWQREFELTRDARKRFQFTVYIDNFANPLQVRIVSAGHTVAQQQIDLRQRFTDSKLAVVLSRNVDLDYLNKSSNGRIRVTYPHPDMLPEQWQGYDGAAVVIMHGVTLDHWSDQQVEALKKWLAQGGRLIVSGGPDYTSLRSERLAELLPVIPTGLTTVNEDAGFRAALGESFAAPQPFQVHRIDADLGHNTPARITLSAAEIPLAVDAVYGLGLVSYLLFDIGAYPFADWAGMTKLWRHNLKWTEPESKRTPPSHKTSVVPEIFRQSTHRFPTRMIVLSFFVVYLGALLALYLTASRSKQPMQMPTWIIPLAFVPVTYLLFVSFLSPAGVSATIVSIVEPLGDGPYARRKLDIGLISSRAELSTLQVDSATAVLLPRVDERRLDQAAHWVQHVPHPQILEVLRQPPHTLHTLWGEDIVDLAMTVEVRETESGLRLAVHNASQVSLQFAWLVFDGWLHPLGALSDAQVSSVEVNSGDVFATNDFSALARRRETDAGQQLLASQTALAHTVRQLRKLTPLQANEAPFVALMTSKWPVVRADASVQVTEIDLLLSRIKVELLPDYSIDHNTVRPHAQ